MDNDLKESMKKIEEAKRRQEKIERIIILLSGFFAVLIFAIVGINIYYSGGDETVSKPQVIIESEEETSTVSYVDKTFEENKKEESLTSIHVKNVESSNKLETRKKVEQQQKGEKVISNDQIKNIKQEVKSSGEKNNEVKIK